MNTKITLSDKELSFIRNTEWILLKQDIMSKVSSLLADCSDFLKTDIIPFHPFPAAALNKPPKISKGENYRQLPYIVLDYPAYFDRRDIFALRTLFWWGNSISIHLHIAGHYVSCVDFSILEKKSDKAFPLYISVADSQWEHYFGEGNYVLCDTLSADSIKEMIRKKGFLKLALKINPEEFETIDQHLERGYRQIAELLISFPNDKKDLSPDNPTVESGL